MTVFIILPEAGTETEHISQMWADKNSKTKHLNFQLSHLAMWHVFLVLRLVYRAWQIRHRELLEVA